MEPIDLGGVSLPPGWFTLPEGVHVSLRLTDSVATATGVVIAIYEPARD